MGKIYYEDPVTKTLSLEIQTAELPIADGSDLELARQKTHIGEDLKRWPTEAQPLTHTRFVSLALAAYDITLCLIPIGLIVKAGLCVLAYHKDSSATGSDIDMASNLSKTLVRFNEQLTTFFTICFILIISTTLRRYALWKVERGATIAELEQYQASISLTSALRAIWSLRAFTFTSLGLIVVWSWYYIGSQAAQREYGLRDSEPLKPIGISLRSDMSKSAFEDGTYNNLTDVEKTDMTAQYHIYIRQGEYTGNDLGADIAGYALIPIYDTDTYEPDKDGWSTIASTGNNPSAYMGDIFYVRVAEDGSLTADETTNQWTVPFLVGSFNYETSYIDLDCQNFTISDRISRPAGLLPSFTISLNMTSSTEATGEDSGRSMDFFGQVNDTHAIHLSCALSRYNFEVDVNCPGQICKVNKMRYSTKKEAQSFDTPFDDDAFASSFIDALLLAAGIPKNIHDLTFFEEDVSSDNWYNDLDEDTAENPSLTYDEVYQLAIEDFSSAISASLIWHINTFYKASIFVKNAPLDQEYLDTGTVTIDNNNPDFQFVTGKGAFYEIKYTLFVPWLVADIISCTILLAAAIFGFWLRTHTLVPDIFGYVSSLTRGDPNLDVPGGSTLSGLERSRRMKHVKVQIGDLTSNLPAGKVGLTYVGGGETKAASLAKDKRYM